MMTVCMGSSTLFIQRIAGSVHFPDIGFHGEGGSHRSFASMLCTQRISNLVYCELESEVSYSASGMEFAGHFVCYSSSNTFKIFMFPLWCV